MLITSHVVHFPLDHGTNVAPSGLFPSVRRESGGSLELGVSAPHNSDIVHRKMAVACSPHHVITLFCGCLS